MIYPLEVTVREITQYKIRMSDRDITFRRQCRPNLMSQTRQHESAGQKPRNREWSHELK